eukprot:CAMPEP_0201926816 /NCGR_PEP_ID=MMETSP0903-20130614/17059_1 /ASSEMBLY_ACC=CAM_ASM_000552 /TAXON_ID=420261 /ORGANISM="Thalassiosira antarctica, Strain CCMP982" /LENGTH=42 /DNA_ID= /DNA_START= /DNA_END= /DNA_ORIENTATION=
MASASSATSHLCVKQPATLLHSSLMFLNDRTRADAVTAVSEF